MYSSELRGYTEGNKESDRSKLKEEFVTLLLYNYKDSIKPSHALETQLDSHQQLQ